MALNSNALTTVAAVAAELGIATPASASAEEIAIQRAINAVSEAIEQYCGRRFAQATAAEKVAGYGRPRLVVSRTPLTAVSSIALNGTAEPSGNYEIENADAGFIRHIEGSWENTADWSGTAAPELSAGTQRPEYAVTYTGGYTLPKDSATPTLPADIEQAAIMSAVVMRRRRGKDTTVQEYGGGDYNTGIGRGIGGLLPDIVRGILAPYRRIL